MAVILWSFLGISREVLLPDGVVGVCCLDNEIFAVCCYASNVPGGGRKVGGLP